MSSSRIRGALPPFRLYAFITWPQGLVCLCYRSLRTDYSQVIKQHCFNRREYIALSVMKFYNAGIGKEAVAVSCKVLFRYVPASTEENHESFLSL